MKKLMSVLLMGLVLAACTDSEYTQALIKNRTGAAALGLSGDFEISIREEGQEPAVLGSAKLEETSPGNVLLSLFEKDGKLSDSKRFALVAVSGKFFLEEQGSNGNYTLNQIVALDPQDPSKGFSILEVNFTDEFKQAPIVKQVESGSGFLSSTFYVADNSTLTAEELIAKTESIDTLHLVFTPAKK